MKTKLLTAVGLLLTGYLLGFIPQTSKARHLRSELVVAKQQLIKWQFSGRLSEARELLAISCLDANRKNLGLRGIIPAVFLMRPGNSPENRPTRI